RPWSGPSASCRPAASWPISSSSLRLGPEGGGEVSVALIVVISLPRPPATRWPHPREAVPDRAGPMILGDSFSGSACYTWVEHVRPRGGAETTSNRSPSL